MQFGKVIGNVIATQKTGKTESLPILVIQLVDEKLQPTQHTIACTDTVHAKPGDIVLTCSSSSARKTERTNGVCTDNSIIAILDSLTIGNKQVNNR